jgi:hypothetical protein
VVSSCERCSTATLNAYVLFVEIVLLALPRKLGKRILEILFPILRRLL